MKVLSKTEKKQNNNAKAGSKKIREKLYNTDFFDLNGNSLIELSVKDFNEAKSMYKFFTRNQVDFYLNILDDTIEYMGNPKDSNTKLVQWGQEKKLEEMDLSLTNLIKGEPGISLEGVKERFSNTGSNGTLDVSVSTLLVQGFLMMSSQNSQILEGVSSLKTQNEELKDQNTVLQNKMDILLKEINFYRTEIEEKKERKQKVLKRKRRDPVTVITNDTFKIIIDSFKGRNSFKDVRLRISLMILFVPVLRISELRFLKIVDVKSLWSREGYLSCKRLKGRGKEKKLKAFLTKEGSTIVNDFRSDFKQLQVYLKSESCLVVCREGSCEESLERAYFTKVVNSFLKKFDTETKTFRSHSFRKSQITKLWKSTNDIEFVRQVIGHSNISTTSSYIDDLTEEEIRARLQSLD